MHKYTDSSFLGNNVPKNTDKVNIIKEVNKTEVGTIPLYEKHELLIFAVQHYHKLSPGNKRDLFKAPKEITEKLCVNYLLHMHTPYDEAFSWVVNPVMQIEARYAFMKKCCKEITKIYPWLNRACKERLKKAQDKAIEIRREHTGN